MKNVALHNLGCKVNSYEIDVMQQSLEENGFSIVPFDEMADIYIVNTCTITNTADAKSRKMLHRARQKNPDAIVVAVGCFVQLDEKALEDASIDLAIGNNKKSELVPILNEYLKNRSAETKTLGGKTIIDISCESNYEEMTLQQIKGHTRAFVKIQDGCNQFCSYCIIPYVRGRARSRAEAAIINEVTGLVNAGCLEIVLTGINLSAYGRDRQEPNALLNLVTKLAKLSKLRRIRFGSLEPRLITPEFVQRMVAMPKICPHFHLSLQSGCNAVLKQMNRHYTTEEYFEKVEMLREGYREKFGDEYQPAITTDIIVGFPGETDADNAETNDFVRKVRFSGIHIFQYSQRKKTKAALMTDQVSAEVKKKRSMVLHETSKILSQNFSLLFLQKNVIIILEEKDMYKNSCYWMGYSAEYLRVAISLSLFSFIDARPGLMVEAKITGYLTLELLEAIIIEVLD